MAEPVTYPGDDEHPDPGCIYCLHNFHLYECDNGCWCDNQGRAETLRDRRAYWEKQRAAEPVTYPGGTQWAIKHNTGTSAFYEPIDAFPVVTEDIANRKFSVALRRVSTSFPDNPELWPQLVSAQITWQVVE